ncbi:MAG: hypothetical protein QGD90_06475 [Candidatus Hydrogenedentes bacterium]|nr:hypothetical protein [Candidatus Hydrogenedentota bacterium]
MTSAARSTAVTAKHGVSPADMKAIGPRVDPETFGAMLELCPPEKTLFHRRGRQGA